MKLKFSRLIVENNQISNFMKISSLGTELFHAGEWTDRQYEADSRFSQFCESV